MSSAARTQIKRQRDRADAWERSFMTMAVGASLHAVAPRVVERAYARRRDGDTSRTPVEASAASRPPATLGDIDHALVRAIARGSRSAMRSLFMRYQARVYRFVKRMVRDHTQAEDLTSDVFLAVWRRADCFEGRSRVSTWLFGIARHKALAALEAALPICRDEEVLLAVRDPGPGPEGELHAREQIAALHRALAALSREHRQIIDLVYYRGKPIKEIADLLGIGLNTVKTRTFYARKRLADMIVAAGV
jgi:RNA polymerase sigma-70 factor (ECF subfamily)